MQHNALLKNVKEAIFKFQIPTHIIRPNEGLHNNFNNITLPHN